MNSLSKHGETVSFFIDDQEIYYDLGKGDMHSHTYMHIHIHIRVYMHVRIYEYVGTIQQKAFFMWCMEKQVNLQVNWVFSKIAWQTP